MNKLIIASAIALAMSAQANAEESKKGDRWVGGFAEYYDINLDKPEPQGFYDDSLSVGFEIGERIGDLWAARLEISYLDVESANTQIGRDDTGVKVGADVLYFLKNDALYVFTGLKSAVLDDTYNMVNVGVGKHWHINDKWRVISEVAAYHDFGQAYQDYSLKLGLGYRFGGKSTPAIPKDGDNDGVIDSKDQCLTTPTGTQVDAKGCNLDLDSDGVINSMDNCPNTPAGTAVDSYGCNKDLDSDGVLNTLDKCPNTPVGTKVGAKGCSLVLDVDQDGVLDSIDQCNNTPITDKVDAIGCSVFTEEEVSTNLQVLFANNSAAISNPDDSQFQEFADFMQRFPNTDSVIEGHASAAGNDDYNMMLSEKRAKAVRTLLVNKYNIDASRLSAKGFGETQLLDTSNTAQAHKVNRRITAKISASKKVKVQR